MIKKTLFLAFFAILFFTSVYAKGHLVIIGGGERSQSMMEKIIHLAGGEQSRIVIIPNASSVPLEVAAYQKEQFESYGVGNVDVIFCTRETADHDSNLAKLEDATGIFFSGGDQSRLTAALLGTKLLQKIKEIYRDGGLISGTSAGAAVMSELMITGNELISQDTTRAFIDIQKGNIEVTPGFGFVTSAVIDQHFVTRKRHNRLITIVLENPGLLGVGIDESTAIVVSPDDTFEVLGEQSVIVYDAKKAAHIRADESGNLGAQNMKMHLLLVGDRFDLKRRKVLH
jgi:cyanophycinase